MELEIGVGTQIHISSIRFVINCANNVIKSTTWLSNITYTRIFWLWAYLKKVIPETRRARYIRYLRVYHIEKDSTLSV